MYMIKTDARPLPIGLNKKVIGLMKDELGGKVMIEFIALRPKLYAYKILNGIEDKRCKEIKKCVVMKTISFDDYKNCLLDVKSKSIYRSQLMFRNDDDKSIVKKDGVTTLARGHYSLCFNSLLEIISLS